MKLLKPGIQLRKGGPIELSSQAKDEQVSPVSRASWNPYFAGGLTGLAVALSFLFYDQLFGVSDAYAFIAKHLWFYTNEQSVLQQDDPTGLSIYLKLTWQLFFVIGIMLGSFLGAYLYGDWKWQGVPDLWRRRFGPGLFKRLTWALLGGFISMTGAMIAGGCPSGLGMSGMIILSLGGFVGFAAFFVGGVIMARLIYRWGDR